MRGESEPADDGMETDEDGCQDHFSSDSDSGGDGKAVVQKQLISAPMLLFPAAMTRKRKMTNSPLYIPI